MEDNHTHVHTTDPDLDGKALSDGEVWEAALRELLLEKKVLTTTELHDQMNRTASQSAAVGASIIGKIRILKKRFWTIPKQQLPISDTTSLKCLIW